MFAAAVLSCFAGAVALTGFPVDGVTRLPFTLADASLGFVAEAEVREVDAGHRDCDLVLALFADQLTLLDVLF